MTATTAALAQRTPSGLQEILGYAKLFHESGMFPDVRSLAQAAVKIQAGAELGLPAFQSMKSVHIIQGTTTLAGHVIAAKVKSHPRYDYVIQESSNKTCKGYFIDKVTGAKNYHEYTWADAERAGDTSKTTYKRFPKAMLFNRWISSGQKMYAPDATNGVLVYTPDELGGEITDTGELAAVEAEIVEPAKPAEEPVRKEAESLHPHLKEYKLVVDAIVGDSGLTGESAKLLRDAIRTTWREICGNAETPYNPAEIPPDKFHGMLTELREAIATTDQTTTQEALDL